MAVDDLDSLDYGDSDDELEGEGGGESGGLKSFFSSSIVKILLYAAAIIVVFLISVITATCVTKSQGKKQRVMSDKEDVSGTKKIYAVFDLKEFMLNTRDTDSAHLAKIKLQLGYPRKNVKLLTELNQRRAQIKDIILLFFNDKRKEDMDTAAKKIRLKEELRKRINRELNNGEIGAIFYEEFSVN